MTLLPIILVAAVREFTGAVFLRSHVTETMKGGITNAATRESDPCVLMYAFLCTLGGGSAFIWFMVATWRDLPVSSHHSVAVGIIDLALVYGGPPLGHLGRGGVRPSPTSPASYRL